MSLKRWIVCLFAAVLSLSVAVHADEKKKEEKKQDKKEEKHEDKKDLKKEVALPDAVAKAWGARYKDATVLEKKQKGDHFEITAKDQWNEKFKGVYAADGKLVSESSRKLLTTNLPAAVADTAKKWAPTAKWADAQEVETKDGMTVYTVSGDVDGKNVKAEIAEDGKVVKADKLPGVKVVKEEKHEKKKEEKKEAK
jgi:hypothetical protein